MLEDESTLCKLEQIGVFIDLKKALGI